MSNSVPKGWEFRELGDYINESIAGEWGSEAQGDKNDIPVLRSTNFTGSGKIDYSKIVFRNIEEKKRIKKALKYGDILIEKSGGSPSQPVGRVVYFDKVIPHLFSNFTQKLTPINECDKKYLFYKLYFEYQNGTVLKFQQQTTGIINFQLAEFLGFKTIFAPLPEQQKIATILSSVDDVIEKTRAQIDKLKDLKTGMMQELLIKGIGHNEFKDSQFGMIPNSWQVKPLGEIFPKIVVGYVGNVNNYYCSRNEGVSFYRTLNIRNGYIRHNPIKYVTKEFNDKNKKSQIFNEDILIARVGANLGMTCKVSGLNSTANIANAIIIKSVKNASSNFYMEFLRSEFGQRQIQSEAAGGAQGVFNTKLAQSLMVPVPPVEEQIVIGNKLALSDLYLNLSEKKVEQLTSLKKSLMQDLLTGKVRVKVAKREEAVA